jgi:hypothetical protein
MSRAHTVEDNPRVRTPWSLRTGPPPTCLDEPSDQHGLPLIVIRTVSITDCAVRRKEEVIRWLLIHHAEQVRHAAQRRTPVVAPGYRSETLNVLFGTPGS